MIELIIVLITSIFLIYIAFQASAKSCPPPTIQYRYTPRTFQEEMDNPVKYTEVFSNIFNESDPLTGGGLGGYIKNIINTSTTSNNSTSSTTQQTTPFHNK